MDREQAKRIIKDTFEASFNEEKFIYFIMNLLNLKQSDIKNTLFGIRQGYNIPEMFRPYISRYQRIAKYLKDNNRIDILIVYLKKETSIEHARSRQRNFIAGYLKGNYGSDKLKDAALVVFVSPNEIDWRFSLVKMDYRFEEGKSGKIKVREKFTPVRRWSFLVGKNESSHTAQSRLVSILFDDQHNPTLTQLEEAFNIEKVTKEFFLKYRNLFLLIKEELDKVVEDDPKVKENFAEKGVDTINFAKKFLGQIIFLYFLQKKGWFGVERDGEWGTGPKDFLRQLFNKKYGNYKNFFNDILEPLFYEALAQERDDDFYSRFNCKIPFLNGGLFEPIGGYDWVHTDINLSNEIFSNRNDNYEGNGVLDIFDLFNFTVKEDEPLEKEVAIDPELLGKIYEKFNAIRPDNYEEYIKVLKSGRKGEENKFNKKFGVYYTPREIVHYMSQESLINYLHTVVNQELRKQPVRTPKQIKLIGPADSEQLGFHTDKEIVDKKAIEELIKYGEQFTENEQVIEEKKKETKTYKYQLLPDIRKNAKVIDEKLKDIRVCDPAVGSGAFPVGMMTEIVKARNVLTAYIKEQNRTPYNFKRECIEKSLYGVDIDPGAVEIAKLRLWLSLIVDEEDIKKIKPLPNLDYKIMQGNSLISEFMGIDLDNDKQNNENAKLFSTDETKELHEILKAKKDELLNQSNINKKKVLRKEIEDLIINIFELKLQKQKSDYFKKFKEIEEKYERHPVKEEREREIKREKDVLSIKTGFNLEDAEKQLKQYTSNQKIRPFFPWKLYFSEVFQEKDGFDVMIANPPYETSRSKGISEYTKRFLRKYYETAEDKYDYYTFFIEKASKLIKKLGYVCFITPSTYLLKPLSKKIRKYILSNFSISRIVEFKGFVFEAVVPTAIILFQNFIPNSNHKIINNYDINNIKDFLDGNFSKNSIKQILFNKEPDYYINIYTDEFFISFFERLINQPDIIRLGKLAEIYNGIQTGNDKKFVCFEKDSKDWYKILTGSDIQKYYKRWGGKYVYYKPELLHSNTRRDIFKTKEKIIIRQTSDRIIGTYDEEGYFTLASTFIIKQFIKKIDYKNLLAILNSNLFLYFYRNINNEEGRVLPQIKKKHIFNLPIKLNFNKNLLIRLVDKILTITKSDDYFQNQSKQDKVKELEKQIDQLVYKLYGLTEEEIKIVENHI